MSPKAPRFPRGSMAVSQAMRGQCSRNYNQLIHGKTAKHTIVHYWIWNDSIKMTLFLFDPQTDACRLIKPLAAPKNRLLAEPADQCRHSVNSPSCCVDRRKPQVVFVKLCKRAVLPRSWRFPFSICQHPGCHPTLHNGSKPALTNYTHC
jgi:hypothetical protein